MLSDKEKGSIERNTGYLSFVGGRGAAEDRREEGGGLRGPPRSSSSCLLAGAVVAGPSCPAPPPAGLADRLFSPSGVLTSALILLVFAGVLRDRTVACM